MGYTFINNKTGEDFCANVWGMETICRTLADIGFAFMTKTELADDSLKKSKDEIFISSFDCKNIADSLEEQLPNLVYWGSGEDPNTIIFLTAEHREYLYEFLTFIRNCSSGFQVI